MYYNRIFSVCCVIVCLFDRLPEVELFHTLDLKMDTRYANDVRAVATAMILYATS